MFASTFPKVNISGLLFCVAVQGITAITPAHSETINSALAHAYNNNPTLNAQRAATRAVDENIPIAKSALRPNVAGEATAGYRNSRTNGVSTTLHPRGFGVTISQTLWDSFLTRNNVEAAHAAIRASQEALRNVEQNVLFDGASAYLDVIQTSQIVGFRRKNLEFLEEQVRSEQARFDVGEATRTDVAQAQASRAAAVSALSGARASFETAKAIYQQIIGHRPTKMSSVKGVGHLLPRSVASAMNIAQNEHPAIKSTEHLVDQAVYNVKASESGLLPSVSVVGNASRSTESALPGVTTDSTSVTATLSVPIYQAGRQSATIRQNKETLGQRRIEVDASVDNVRAAVVSAFSQHQAAKASVSANQEQLRAARLALAGAVEERKVGQRTTLDVLNTQTTVINAQISLASSQRDLKVAGYAILSSIGRLSAKRLGLQVVAYDPEEHLNAVKDKWFGLRTPSGN